MLFFPHQNTGISNLAEQAYAGYARSWARLAKARASQACMPRSACEQEYGRDKGKKRNK